ncbi:MAG: AP2 domain-containing protein [Butyrivibrio sp.]
MPAKYKIGQVVGGVTIVGTVPDEKYNKYLLRCNSCGTEFVDYATFVRKHPNGCTDCNKEANREKRCKDEIGKTYNNLKIISYDKESTDNGATSSIYVKCQCLKCNSVSSIPLSRVKAGLVKECVSCARKNLNLGREFVKADSVQGTRLSCLDKKSVNKNNTSGYNGVSRCKDGRYRAYINFQRKQYNLGTYKSLEKAHKVRMQAEKEIYGNFKKWYADTFPEKWEQLNKKKNKGNL